MKHTDRFKHISLFVALVMLLSIVMPIPGYMADRNMFGSMLTDVTDSITDGEITEIGDITTTTDPSIFPNIVDEDISSREQYSKDFRLEDGTRLLVDLILVAVPVGHTALVRTVLFLLPAGFLMNRLTAVVAENLSLLGRMPLQMEFDGIGGNSQLVSDPLIPHTHTGISVDLIHGFVCHGCLLS